MTNTSPIDIDVDNFETQTFAQDEPPPDALARENDSMASKGKFYTAEELTRVATREFREQSALRGPILVPEWGNALFMCRRLNYLEQTELVNQYREHGDIGAFCYRALNDKGERVFKTPTLFIDAFQKRITPAIVNRVHDEMVKLCATQLTDAELGNS